MDGVSNNFNNQNLNQPIKKKRGRPRKYGRPVNNLNLNIEKDLILFIPFINAVKEKSESDYITEFDKLLKLSKLTDEEKLNNISEVDELKDIIKKQSNTINKYKLEIKDFKLYNNNIKSSLLSCPFKLNEKGDIIIPEYTEVCCFHDSCKIKGKPIFLPDKKENGQFYIIGWFCSFNCAMAYNFDLRDNRISERLSLLKQLYKINNYIKPAPSNKVLKKYGGTLTIEEYRNLFYDKFNNYNYIISPIKCLNMFIEKI